MDCPLSDKRHLDDFAKKWISVNHSESGHYLCEYQNLETLCDVFLVFTNLHIVLLGISKSGKTSKKVDFNGCVY